jgi:heme oxygenase
VNLTTGARSVEERRASPPECRARPTRGHGRCVETEFYVQRIQTLAPDDPIAWIAHGYTRYLADLSGGLVIDKAITAAYGLEQDGRRLYTFDLPAGVDPKTWKNAYRQLLNVLDLDTPTAVRLIEEALVAYQCNIALNDALVERHRDIRLAGQVA